MPDATPDYLGPPIDDPETLARLPDELRALLEKANGFVLLGGGLHLRGACKTPAWHSLGRAWDGPMAIHRLFRQVTPEDVPFAQDALGDQFILRDGQVHQLWSETGILEALDLDLGGFLQKVEEDPLNFLEMAPLRLLEDDGERLAPGQLLHVFPPLCTQQASEGVHLKPVAADDCLRFLSELAAQLDGLEDGVAIELNWKR